MKKKEILFGFIAVCLSLFVCMALAEIALRFLPVSEGMRSQSVTFDQPVHKFQSDDRVRWSRDWNFSIITDLRVNNAGFVNKYDYAPHGAAPVFAVIGDSFVEAAQVPYEESFHGLLERDARDKYDGRFHVYSFGAGGAPLSQYLVFAKHARENYNVKAMAIVIINNDYDESLPKYHYQDTFHQFIKNDEGEYELKLLREYRSTWWKELLRGSALVRYLYFNVEMSRGWWKLKARISSGGRRKDDVFVDRTQRESPQYMEASKEAVDAFFRLLPAYAGLPPEKILFVVDAVRPLVYEGKTVGDNGYISQMNRYFMGRAIIEGYEVADMTQPFTKRYAETGKKFEWPTDGHWNGEGHKAVYEAVRDSLIYRDFISSAKEEDGR